MDNIAGMRDGFGLELRRRRFLAQVFASVAESFGYEPVSISLIERAEAYSEDIVGLSPWPEWNRRGCFFFPIEDYVGGYDQQPSITDAVLVPEGTLSITRWLGAQLDQDSAATLLPMRIYYEQPCFRNELLGTLGKGKVRAFSQFGLEILGGRGVVADVEPLVLANEMLVAAAGTGTPPVEFRISSNKLFLALAAEAGLTAQQRVQAKEALDTLAECKAGKRPEREPVTRRELMDLLSGTSTGRLLPLWTYIIDRPPGLIADSDVRAFADLMPDEVEYLRDVTQVLNEHGICCTIDFCVVRSHEYYTGLTFEIDLLGADTRYVEVGGGGRYDRLLGNFVAPGGPEQVPSTGFAFGLERLQAALEAERSLPERADRPRTFDLSSGQVRRYPALDPGSAPADAAAAYLTSVRTLRSERQDQRIAVDL